MQLILGEFVICPGCQKRYKHRGSLKVHQKYECGKEPMFGCYLCPMRVHRVHNVRRHLLLVHKQRLTLDEVLARNPCQNQNKI